MQKLDLLDKVEDPQRRQELILVLMAHETATKAVADALEALTSVHPSLNHVMNGDVYERFDKAIVALRDVVDDLAWCLIEWYGDPQETEKTPAEGGR